MRRNRSPAQPPSLITALLLLAQGALGTLFVLRLLGRF